MKYSVILLFLLLLSPGISAQINSVGIVAGGGITIVDVAKVVEPYVLSDWNTFSGFAKGFVEFKSGESGAFGVEAGTNRLYYWEYPAPGYSWYNWRTEWTINAAAYFLKNIGSRLFVQAGAGVHVFHNGVVPGLLSAVGVNFSLGEKITMPLMLRVEPVFGTATPIAVNVGTGLRLKLSK